jgi:hypothetical protein
MLDRFIRRHRAVSTLVLAVFLGLLCLLYLAQLLSWSY